MKSIVLCLVGSLLIAISIYQGFIQQRIVILSGPSTSMGGKQAVTGRDAVILGLFGTLGGAALVVAGVLRIRSAGRPPGGGSDGGNDWD